MFGYSVNSSTAVLAETFDLGEVLYARLIKRKGRAKDSLQNSTFTFSTGKKNNNF